MAWGRGRYSTVGNMGGGSNPAGALCELPQSVSEQSEILDFQGPGCQLRSNVQYEVETTIPGFKNQLMSKL